MYIDLLDIHKLKEPAKIKRIQCYRAVVWIEGEGNQGEENIKKRKKKKKIL